MMRTLTIGSVGTCLLVVFMVTLAPIHADEVLPPPALSIENELRWLQSERVVFSVSKKLETLFDTPAAAYIITNEDIRRSGANSVAEALRMVPGISVARVDSSKWAVAARGFNNRFNSTVLVLKDGHSVYKRLSGATYWETHETIVLEDIERIEVIRGPGATLWGANAVNGVVNIITKNSADTQGGYVELAGGTEDRGFVNFRYGGQFNEDMSYRVYGKGFERDSFEEISTVGTQDDWQSVSGGMRLDWTPTTSDAIKIELNFYEQTNGTVITEVDLDATQTPFVNVVNDDAETSNGSFLVSWDHSLSNSSAMKLQMFLDRTVRDDLNYGVQQNIADIDFQHTFALGDRHKIVWGLGYNYLRDKTDPSKSFFFPGETRQTDQVSNTFLEDTIELVDEQLFLTLGSKLEHNDYSGVEVQPNIKLRWSPSDRTTFWASVARALETPGRSETDALWAADKFAFTAPNGLRVIQTNGLNGSEKLRSEEVIAYDIGVRLRATDRLMIEFAAFYNDYSELRDGTPDITRVLTTDPNTGEQTLNVRANVVPTNDQTAESYGIEVNADWELLENWRVAAHYSFLKVQRHSTSVFDVEVDEAVDPQNQAHIRSFFDLPGNVQLDVGVYYVDLITEKSFSDPNAGSIPSYIRTDARIAWQATENIEIGLVGQNLFDSKHQEFRRSIVRELPSEIERSVYAYITCEF